MFNWFWKALGYHVCEEFTRWEVCQANFQRPADMATEFPQWEKGEPIRQTKTWQQRACTECGKLQQKKCSYPVHGVHKINPTEQEHEP